MPQQAALTEEADLLQESRSAAGDDESVTPPPRYRVEPESRIAPKTPLVIPLMEKTFIYSQAEVVSFAMKGLVGGGVPFGFCSQFISA